MYLTLQSSNAIYGVVLKNYSEQQILDCTPADTEYDIPNSCQGGNTQVGL